MNLKLFEEIYNELKPRNAEIIFNVKGQNFRIVGIIQEIVYYDALEPDIGERITVKTDLTDFDIDMYTVREIKWM